MQDRKVKCGLCPNEIPVGTPHYSTMQDGKYIDVCAKCAGKEGTLPFDQAAERHFTPPEKGGDNDCTKVSLSTEYNR